MTPNKWWALAAGLYLEFLAGLIYAFPIYSGDLKRILGFSQDQLSWCATLGTAGGNLGITSGFALDYFGSGRTARYGSCLAGAGFLGIYLCSRGTLDIGVWGTGAFFFIAYQGLTWIDTSVIGCMIGNFPSEKGLACGVVKTQNGIASSAVVILSVGLFGGSGGLSTKPYCEGDHYLFTAEELGVVSSRDPFLPFGLTVDNLLEYVPSGVSGMVHAMSVEKGDGIPLLLFCSLLTLVLGNIACRALLVEKGDYKSKMLDPRYRSRFYNAFYCVIFIMVYLAVCSILNIAWQTRDGVPEGSQLAFAIVQIILYVFPWFLVYAGWKDTQEAETQQQKGYGVDGVDPSPLLDEPSEPFASLIPIPYSVTKSFRDAQGNEDPVTKSFRETEVMKSLETADLDDDAVVKVMPMFHDYTYFEALTSFDFWCLFVFFFGGSTGAYMTIGQLSQINSALGGSPADKAVLVIILGVSSCTGRMFWGFVQDKLVRATYPRPFFALLVVLTQALGQTILAFTPNSTCGGLHAGIVLTGLAFGSTWSLTGPLSSDIMGQKSFGRIYSTVVTSAMIGTLVFNQVIAGPNYDKQYELQPENPDSMCCGNVCYRAAHLTAATATMCAALCNILLLRLLCARLCVPLPSGCARVAGTARRTGASKRSACCALPNAIFACHFSPPNAVFLREARCDQCAKYARPNSLLVISWMTQYFKWHNRSTLISLFSINRSGINMYVLKPSFESSWQEVFDTNNFNKKILATSMNKWEA